MDRRRLVGLAMAAGSGVLYGSINVLAKLVDAHPAVKAAMMYLVSATVLLPWSLRLRLQRRDWPKALTMGLVGGGLAPVLLFFGLQRAAAADAALLLTLEMVATSAFAFLFLHERFARREGLGLLCLLLAALAVAMANGRGGQSSPLGIVFVLAAAVAWGVDNTVSARLVGDYDPRGLIGLKGALGGGAALVLALVLRAPVPRLPAGASLAALGVASIAVSSLLFYYALRHVGAARTSAMNIATTGLVGAFGGVLLLGERLVWLHGVAIAAVLAGAWLLATHRAPKADSSRTAGGP